VWVASVSNGYFGYATTPEEYSRQNYEGGHTLYGRYTTPYLAAQLGLLARDFNARGTVHELELDWMYVLKASTFYPEAQISKGWRRMVLQPHVVKAEAECEEDYIAFQWADVGPDKIDFHRPLSQIEIKVDERWMPMVDDGKPIDDDGYDMEVRYLEELGDGTGEYEVRWYNPVPGGTYRFRIEPRGKHPVLTSRAFLYKRSANGCDEGTVLMIASDQ